MNCLSLYRDDDNLLLTVQVHSQLCYAAIYVTGEIRHSRYTCFFYSS